MSRWQKISYFNLVVTVLGFGIVAIAAARMSFEQFIMPPNFVSLVLVLTFALVAAAPKFFFPRRPQAVDCDERDAEIHRIFL